MLRRGIKHQVHDLELFYDEPSLRNEKAQKCFIQNRFTVTRVMTSLMNDDTQLFKQFMDNENFKRWMSDASFELVYRQPSES